MNDTYEVHLDAIFKKLHQDAATVYGNVYDSIRRQLKGSSSRGLSGEIAQLEARKLNQEILQLTADVKQVAISEMIACGCKTYLTEAGWMEIQQAAGLPHTELCKVQVDSMRGASGSGTVGKNQGLRELAHQYDMAEKALLGISVAGVAGVVISLFIPGWSLPVKVLCASGAIVAVAGGGMALNYAVKKDEAMSKFNRIGNSDSPRNQNDSPLDVLVKQITDSQYRRNLGLYDEWLAKIKKALIAECDKLAAMCAV